MVFLDYLIACFLVGYIFTDLAIKSQRKTTKVTVRKKDGTQFTYTVTYKKGGDMDKLVGEFRCMDLGEEQ